MDKHQILQETEVEKLHKMSQPSPALRFAANPNSWFRKRLDYVRSEARKDIQLKSIRPLHEK